MSRITELKQQLDEYRTAEQTAAALKDVSMLRIQAIRGTFEKNRAFYEGVRVLYGEVRAAAKETATPAHPQKATIYVAITSNKRFFGTLMKDTVSTLVRELARAKGADALVIGRSGWQYLSESTIPRGIEKLFFENDVPSSEEFEKLLTHVSEYNQVFVLYPAFINIFKQEIRIEDIAKAHHAPVDQSVVAKMQKTEEQYLFEPEISMILEFFDTQVRRALLSAVLLEAELARTSARLVRMDEAQDRAKKLVTSGAARMRHEVASVSNAQLLETFAGFTRWNTL